MEGLVSGTDLDGLKYKIYGYSVEILLSRWLVAVRERLLEFKLLNSSTCSGIGCDTSPRW